MSNFNLQNLKEEAEREREILEEYARDNVLILTEDFATHCHISESEARAIINTHSFGLGL